MQNYMPVTDRGKKEDQQVFELPRWCRKQLGNYNGVNHQRIMLQYHLRSICKLPEYL